MSNKPSDYTEIPPALQARVRAGLEASYADKIGINHGGLPRHDEVLELLERLFAAILPGFSGERHDLEPDALLADIYRRVASLSYRIFRFFCTGRQGCPGCDAATRSSEAAAALLEALPAIREAVKLDIAAAYAGDPAATGPEEIILAYPCIRTLTTQRLAHVLYQTKIPLMPRLMTEHAHSLTGIDIHPGATLGKGVFIDHGTGVVVGQTATIGDNVRIYQGVTLGALSFPKDACGMLIKGQKRHPTVEANVTIYAGATVLGDIIIGHDSVIGGNVWLTESVPAHTKITARPPELSIRVGSKKGSTEA